MNSINRVLLVVAIAFAQLFFSHALKAQSDSTAYNKPSYSTSTIKTELISDTSVYFPSELVKAQFPGGETEYQKHLTTSLLNTSKKYTDLNDNGTVIVNFIVEKNGSISNIKLLRGLAICTKCNEEVINIIKKMPTWEPGLSKGKPVRLQYTLPIRFDHD